MTSIRFNSCYYPNSATTLKISPLPLLARSLVARRYGTLHIVQQNDLWNGRCAPTVTQMCTVVLTGTLKHMRANSFRTHTVTKKKSKSNRNANHDSDGSAPPSDLLYDPLPSQAVPAFNKCHDTTDDAHARGTRVRVHREGQAPSS